MIIPALTLVAPLVATSIKQYLDHRSSVARTEAVRDAAVVGIIVVGATTICGFVADEAHHRASLKHLETALNRAVENDDAEMAADLISELRRQLRRRTLPRKLVASAERSIESAIRRLGAHVATESAADDLDQGGASALVAAA